MGTGRPPRGSTGEPIGRTRGYTNWCSGGLMVQLLSFLKRSENLIFENVKTYNLLLLQSYFERILNLRFVEQLSPVEAENFEIECIQTKAEHTCTKREIEFKPKESTYQKRNSSPKL